MASRQAASCGRAHSPDPSNAAAPVAHGPEPPGLNEDGEWPKLEVAVAPISPEPVSQPRPSRPSRRSPACRYARRA